MTQFGVFLPNGSNGYMMSKACEPYAPTYEHNMAITLEAERQGLNFVLPMMKFRGFGGETGCWDACLDAFSLSSALAAITDRITMLPTASMLALHPAVTARLVATLSEIGGGRCGVNLITGWNKPEYDQMGLWPGDEYYDERYAFAEDYVRILRALWDQGEVHFQSKYFDLKDCQCFPTPKSHVPIVSAGQSPKGISFCENFADYRFMIGNPPVIETLRSQMTTGRTKRNGSYLLFHLLVGETDDIAEKRGREIIELADHPAIENMLASAAMDSNTEGTSAALQAGLSRTLEEGNLAFGAHPVIHGSAKTVAEKIDSIAEETGADGFMFAWIDYVPGVKEFGEKIKPLLRCAR